MRPLRLSLLFLLFFKTSLFATVHDSLFQVSTNVSLPDSSRLNAIGVLAESFARVLPDSCLYYASIYGDLARELESDSHLANSLHLASLAYLVQGNIDSSSASAQRSLIVRGKGEISPETAASLNILGAIFMRQGNHAKAMEYYLKCLKISEEIGVARGISASHHNIGRIYAHQEDLHKALEHFKASLENKASEDLIGRSNEIEMMATTYADLNEDSLSLVLFQEALQLRLETGDPVGIGMSYSNLGAYYLNPSTVDTAIYYTLKCITEFEKVEDIQGLAHAFITMAEAYQIKNEHEMSINWGKKAMTYSEKSKELRLVEVSAKVLSESLKALGRDKQALEYFEMHVLLKDSIQNEENQRAVLRQEYAYQYEKESLTDSLEFAKKEAVLQEKTEKQRVGLAATGGGLILLLALAFTIYTGKKKSDELLLNILPAETAEELKKKGEAEAKLVDNVTVLFTDFKGFTAMSEQLGPKELVKDIHDCFSKFDLIMDKYGIEKIKTIGDAYMAAGGLPTPNSTHAQDVVKAALEMAHVVEKGKRQKVEMGLPFFEIRIGVHTGPVVAGIVGVKKFQYDIWGDTVNTASRMESSGEVGKVNISQTTYELVKDQFACEHRGKVEAKGKGEIDMYFVKAIA